MQIEYHVEGADTLALRVRAEGEHVKNEIIDAIGDALRAADIEMRMRVPVDDGELFNSIRISPVVFRPGGLGGGGFYEAELSAGEGVEHLAFVTEGTGEHGPTGQRITPKRGNVLRFQKKGEPMKFRPSVSGQEAQDEWITAAQAVANSILEQRISRI